MKTTTTTCNPSQSQNISLYLRLSLAPNTPALLPMTDVKEVLSIKRDRITPIPNMPECFFGLLNQRSRIFWVVDLPQLLGMTPVERSSQQYNLILLGRQNSAFAAVVPRIEGVSRLDSATIQAPSQHIATELASYLQGCLFQENQPLLVLDSEYLLTSPQLSGY